MLALPAFDLVERFAPLLLLLGFLGLLLGLELRARRARRVNLRRRLQKYAKAVARVAAGAAFGPAGAAISATESAPRQYSERAELLRAGGLEEAAAEELTAEKFKRECVGLVDAGDDELDKFLERWRGKVPARVVARVVAPATLTPKEIEPEEEDEDDDEEELRAAAPVRDEARDGPLVLEIPVDNNPYGAQLVLEISTNGEAAGGFDVATYNGQSYWREHIVAPPSCWGNRHCFTRPAIRRLCFPSIKGIERITVHVGGNIVLEADPVALRALQDLSR